MNIILKASLCRLELCFFFSQNKRWVVTVDVLREAARSISMIFRMRHAQFTRPLDNTIIAENKLCGKQTFITHLAHQRESQQLKSTFMMIADLRTFCSHLLATLKLWNPWAGCLPMFFYLSNPTKFCEPDNFSQTIWPKGRFHPVSVVTPEEGRWLRL